MTTSDFPGKITDSAYRIIGTGISITLAVISFIAIGIVLYSLFAR